MTVDSAEGLRLEIDEEIDAMLRLATIDETTGPSAEQGKALASGMAQGLRDQSVERFTWGLARALQRNAAKQAELDEYRRKILAEVVFSMSQLKMRAAVLETHMDSLVLERREADLGNQLRIPGVGTWSTRKVPEHFKVGDESLVLQAMPADEREEFATLPDPEWKLDTRAYAAHLKATGIDTSEPPLGMEFVEERTSVSYQLGD